MHEVIPHTYQSLILRAYCWQNAMPEVHEDLIEFFFNALISLNLLIVLYNVKFMWPQELKTHLYMRFQLEP